MTRARFETFVGWMVLLAVVALFGWLALSLAQSPNLGTRTVLAVFYSDSGCVQRTEPYVGTYGCRRENGGLQIQAGEHSRVYLPANAGCLEHPTDDLIEKTLKMRCNEDSP